MRSITLLLLAGCVAQNPIRLTQPDLSTSPSSPEVDTRDLEGPINDLSSHPNDVGANDVGANDLAANDSRANDQGANDLGANDLSTSQGPDLTTCVKETDQAFCARMGKSCGTVVSFDNCGASRSTICGACDLPQTCGAVTPGLCGCVAETNAAFCARFGATCGFVSNTDNCGASRSVSCGPSCPCVPESDLAVCQMYNLTCTPASANDNCGNLRSLSCRQGCTAGICPGLSDGSNCATSTIGGDWMNNCLNQKCVPALGFCQLDNASNTWSFQKPGEGGGGANSCACTSSTHLSLRFNSIPAANVDMDCSECVELPGRVVCF
jgi:hypothetical protein